MMLSTPPMASEPYTADAPSCRISIDFTALAGIELRSTAPDTPEPDEPLTQRRPSTSTSTRLEVRYRRSISAAPAPIPPPSGGNPRLPDELLEALIAEPAIGRRWTNSASEVAPVAL